MYTFLAGVFSFPLETYISIGVEPLDLRITPLKPFEDLIDDFPLSGDTTLCLHALSDIPAVPMDDTKLCFLIFFLCFRQSCVAEAGLELVIL